MKMQFIDKMILSLIKKGYRTDRIISDLGVTKCRVKLLRQKHKIGEI